MKRRILSICLVLVLIFSMLPTTVGAATDLVIPNDWSHDALQFAVDNGILRGDANRNLRPGDPMTRAEMATVLVRLLNLTEEADVSNYTDVIPGLWYVSAVARAVAAGVFNGVSPTLMAPNSHITREQAMTTFYRTLGLTCTKSDSYMRYNDSSIISDYARGPISQLADMGALAVITDSNLQPKKEITRAEFAQMIYNTLTCIATDPSQLPAKGNVLYNSTEPLPTNYTLNGSLYLTGAASELTVTNLNVSSRLALGRVKLLEADNLSADELFIFKPDSTVTFASGRAEKVYLSANNVTYSGDCDHLTVTGSKAASITTNAKMALFVNSSANVSGSMYTSHVSNSHLMGDAFNGTLFIYDNNSSVAGHTISHLASYANNPDVMFSTIQKIMDRSGTGANAVQLSTTNPPPLTETDTTVTFTANYRFGDQYGLYGTVSWIRGNTPIHTNSFLMTGDASVEQIVRSYHLDKTAITDSYRIVITIGDSSKEVTTTLTTDSARFDYDNALSIVHTANVPMTVTTSCYVYSNSSLSRSLRWVSAGTTLYNEYNLVNGVLKCSFPDTGEYGYIKRSNVHIAGWNVTTSEPYSTAACEGFVNKKGYTSSTNYLFWISKMTQHVYVFVRSHGAWKLDRSILCATGTNETPTPRGVFSTNKKESRWCWDDCFAFNPVHFWDGNGFHSILYNYNGTIYDGTLGTPRSHGCIRMSYENILYLSSKPLYTTVVCY